MPERPKNLVVAIFLNALVLPGAGHWLVGLSKRGFAMMSAVLLLLCVPLLRFAITVTQLVQESMVRTGMPMRTLKALSTAWQSQRTFSLICIAGIVLIWIYGIVDLVRRR